MWSACTRNLEFSNTVRRFFSSTSRGLSESFNLPPFPALGVGIDVAPVSGQNGAMLHAPLSGGPWQCPLLARSNPVAREPHCSWAHLFSWQFRCRCSLRPGMSPGTATWLPKPIALAATNLSVQHQPGRLSLIHISEPTRLLSI